jgi:heme/copper-type cytochrome/quinol oxidase subunit 2
MRLSRHFVASIFLLLAVCATADVASACPGCKQALATAEGDQANMVNGYFWSILFMLSMPFTILGLFSGSMYLAVRKARRAQQQRQGAVGLTDMVTH